jgi:hypothetical protein
VILYFSIQTRTNLVNWNKDEADEVMVEVLREAGLRPEWIYAFEKTGLLVTEENHHRLDAADIAEWDAAVAEFLRLERDATASLHPGSSEPTPGRKPSRSGR